MASQTLSDRRAFRYAVAEIKAEQFAKRERGIEIRKAATAAYFGDQFAIWWAIAFKCRLGKQVADGDLTRIVGYDTLAASMAHEFPEFSDDDGPARLWGFLLSPHDPMPQREEIERMARERLEYQAGRMHGLAWGVK